MVIKATAEKADFPHWPTEQGEEFRRLYCQWLQLRAELEALEVDAPQPFEAKYHDVTASLEKTVRLALTTHVPSDWMVWQKFEILERELYGLGDSGRKAGREFVWMIAGIKADLLSLGIGRDRRGEA